MSRLAWEVDAFFEECEDPSVDGGTTSHGSLWHAISSRWGHSMHPMCSYQGMFPAKLVHWFVQRYSREGETVLDPFSGRGTTLLQSRAEGRRAVGGDLNPLAHVLTRAKANPPSWQELMNFLSQLEKRFSMRRYRETDVPDDIRMLFHPKTLAQIVFLRDAILGSGWSSDETMTAACMAGILHGNHRADGSSAYLSISMPNTFSMSPQYVRRFISERGLVAPEQDVFERLRDKMARLYLDDLDGPTARAHNRDAVVLLRRVLRRESIDLVITSPPYLQVMNYGTFNWIRLWWLGIEEVSRQQGSGRLHLDGQLDHRHGFSSYLRFMERVFSGVRRVLKPDGIAVFVIGDVARPAEEAFDLAKMLWAEIGPQSGLVLVDLIEDSLATHSKVSRIWGDTKGRATDRDCVLILGRADGKPRKPRDEIDWSEPYADAGPDAAHQRTRTTDRSTK